MKQIIAQETKRAICEVVKSVVVNLVSELCFQINKTKIIEIRYLIVNKRFILTSLSPSRDFASQQLKYIEY